MSEEELSGDVGNDFQDDYNGVADAIAELRPADDVLTGLSPTERLELEQTWTQTREALKARLDKVRADFQASDEPTTSTFSSAEVFEYQRQAKSQARRELGDLHRQVLDILGGLKPVEKMVPGVPVTTGTSSGESAVSATHIAVGTTPGTSETQPQPVSVVRSGGEEDTAVATGKERRPPNPGRMPRGGPSGGNPTS